MKLKSIAFIDCYTETPVNNSVNSYCLHSNKVIPTYHMPSKYGLKSLENLERVDGYIILGSASHVSDKLSWHKELLDFIIPKIESNIPTLGICFGHQLIADYYGCQIGYINDDHSINTHARDIEFTANESNYKQNAKMKLGFAHSQVVTKITNDFTSFAKSSLSEFEALKHNRYNYWSVQAHPEANEYFLKSEVNLCSETDTSEIITNGYSLIDKFVDLV